MLTLGTAAIAAPASAATRSFSCTDTTYTRAQYRQAVTGTLDASNVPLNVVVTRAYTGKVEITSAHPTLDPNLDGGYWYQHHGWQAWPLGVVNANTYWFCEACTAS